MDRGLNDTDKQTALGSTRFDFGSPLSMKLVVLWALTGWDFASPQSGKLENDSHHCPPVIENPSSGFSGGDGFFSRLRRFWENVRLFIPRLRFFFFFFPRWKLARAH